MLLCQPATSFIFQRVVDGVTQFSGRGILLDIEGTTSSVSFVYDVMFPYVRKHLTFEVLTNWDESDYIAAIEAIAKDAAHESLSTWLKTHRLSRDNPLRAA